MAKFLNNHFPTGELDSQVTRETAGWCHIYLINLHSRLFEERCNRKHKISVLKINFVMLSHPSQCWSQAINTLKKNLFPQATDKYGTFAALVEVIVNQQTHPLNWYVKIHKRGTQYDKGIHVGVWGKLEISPPDGMK